MNSSVQILKLQCPRGFHHTKPKQNEQIHILRPFTGVYLQPFRGNQRLGAQSHVRHNRHCLIVYTEIYYVLNNLLMFL